MRRVSLPIVIEPALLFEGRYELGPVIGRGGMAEVRSGRDTRLDRPVAVKLLRSAMAHQPGVRSRFESEGRLAARLVHPNVVAVFDSGEADGVPYIVMERLPGETLHDRMGRGRMTAEEVRDVAVAVLRALQAAHGAGIVHRDIKPGNVLATAAGGWKVGDFGIAKALEADGTDPTTTGLLIGTPAYLAPERFFGAPATVASDLYSVGVMLYEAVAGQKPFQAERAEAWAATVAGTSPAPLSRIRRDVDPALEAVIDRCLAKDPAGRFWSAAEMLALLGGSGPPTRGSGHRLGQMLRRRDALAARVALAVVAVAAVVAILVVALSRAGAGSTSTTNPATTTATTTTTPATTTATPATTTTAPATTTAAPAVNQPPRAGQRRANPGEPAGPHGHAKH